MTPYLYIHNKEKPFFQNKILKVRSSHFMLLVDEIIRDYCLQHHSNDSILFDTQSIFNWQIEPVHPPVTLFIVPFDFPNDFIFFESGMNAFLLAVTDECMDKYNTYTCHPEQLFFKWIFPMSKSDQKTFFFNNYGS